MKNAKIAPSLLFSFGILCLSSFFVLEIEERQEKMDQRFTHEVEKNHSMILNKNKDAIRKIRKNH